MARMRGHRPTMILLSFVGLTFFEARKARASDEFLIAISGPMVNLGVAILLEPFIGIALAADNAPSLFSLAGMASWQGFLAWLSMLNFAVAALNMTPGWPADGARAMRAGLARKHGYGMGTQRAVAISHGLWLSLAGVSVILLTVVPRFQAMTDANPARSPASLLAMYQVVALLLAAIGIYYGWAENRRVRRLGEARAAEVVGPPPEFKPGAKQDKSRVIDAEVAEPASDEPTLKERASRAAAAGTVAWKVAKATGKGTGWLLKQGAKAVGGMFIADKKPEGEQK
jgi:Zn-dependent protease